MPRLDDNERIQHRGVALAGVAITAMIAASAMTGSCFPNTETFVCNSGRRCPAGQICALNQDVCINVGGCGNGHLDPGEVCDDGNIMDGDGCRNDCQSTEICGNGQLDEGAGETCDDGNRLDGDGCSSSCTLEVCGNGHLDPGEVCDDSNTTPGDGCSPDCKSNEACGNGIIDDDGPIHEDCDPEKTFPLPAHDTPACDSDCTFPRCGDGHFNPYYIIPTTGKHEQCDTGMDSQSCDGDCTFVECGDSHVNMAAGEECDEGSQNSNLPDATCRPDCRKQSCGDGIVDTGEQCDDGNNDTSDGCPSGPKGTCKPAKCGDNFVRIGVEQCDPPNSLCLDNVSTCGSDCRCH